jgi:hypothetical protein
MMSKMAELDMEIRNMLDEGLEPVNIANILKCPLQMVFDVIDSDYDNHYDYMDGDHDSAMASAGFGTDEDYGYFGDEE